MATHFEVSDVDQDAINGATRFVVSDFDLNDYERSQVTPPVQHQGEPVNGKESKQFLTVHDQVEKNQLSVTSVVSGNLALYEEDIEKNPRIATFLNSLKPVDGTAPNVKSMKKKKKANLGTLMGVYLPTLQNILGVILFLRLPWIVGISGVGMAVLIVCLCCITTLLTSISLSAIATNGHVPAGGAYFMLSRNLGPEFGGAVGILFYLANTFATSLYTVGAIEILVTYIFPQVTLFPNITGNTERLNNDIRVFGTILLLLLTIIVFVGVKLVNWFATVCLIAVLVAVLSIYAGAFNPIPRVPLCEVNGAALEGRFNCDQDIVATVNNMTWLSEYLEDDCDMNDTIDITKICSEFNPRLKLSFNGTFFTLRRGVSPNLTDTDCEASDPSIGNWSVPPTCVFGVPGIATVQNIIENTPIEYLEEGEVSPGVKGVGVQVSAEITTSFLVLIGIFFPSVTGIMAGSNRSGDLKDAQKSIPIGTIAAVCTTSLIYLTCVLFFGGTISRLMLKDQFGYASGLTVSLLAWPTKYIILVGALLSTIGAGLQSLTGAPRLLQAIANDDLMFFLKLFKRTGLNGEPTFALVLTALLSEIGVLIASLDLVAPILTMFFLICYMFVNFACALQSILKAPNWRPRFRFYHWSTSLIGALLCIILMFLVSWYYALVALLLAGVIYKYIEYRGAEKEWGDGVTGLSLQAALYSLLKLEERPLHTKNWRPQLLLLCKLDDNLIPAHPKMLSFASQLKEGKGLMMISSVVQGNFSDVTTEAVSVAAKQSLKRFTKDNKIEGFCEVVVANNVPDGLSYFIQCSGLGGMRHNTVVICWPDAWRKKTTWRLFIDTIRVASVREKAILVPKGINWYPSNRDHKKGFIDIWWVVHDGGLLMLLPFLLRQHKVWRQCKLRIFTVAQIEDNSIQMKKDLAAFLYQLRIPAQVDVIEMPDNDISAYTYERTLIMEQRNQMLKQMRFTERQKRGDVQHLLARSFSQKGLLSLPSQQEVSPLHQRGPANQTTSMDNISVGELSVEPRVIGPSENELVELSNPLARTTNVSAAIEDPNLNQTDVVIEVPTSIIVSTPPSSLPPQPDVPPQSSDVGDIPPAEPSERARKNSLSSSESDSCPEEQSVRTPLLENQPNPTITILPTNPAPSIKKYDEMFSSPVPEEEIPLGGSAENLRNQPKEDNLRRMNTSVKLNELIVEKSHDASLVIVNLPAPPRTEGAEENYMEFLDVLTEGIECVLMVRGGGREVITIYS